MSGQEPERRSGRPIKLDEQAFRDLVAGKVVDLAGGKVRLLLANVGWKQMLQAISEAME